MYGRPDMPFLTYVPLIILSSVIAVTRRNKIRNEHISVQKVTEKRLELYANVIVTIILDVNIRGNRIRCWPYLRWKDACKRYMTEAIAEIIQHIKHGSMEE